MNLLTKSKKGYMMKRFIFLILFLLMLPVLLSVKVYSADDWFIGMGQDTFFYHWEIRQYPELKKTLMRNTSYNGHTFVTGFVPGWQQYSMAYSKDFLSSWIQDSCYMPNSNIFGTKYYMLQVYDYTLLPDDRMLMMAYNNYLFESSDFGRHWTEHQYDIFQKKYLSSIIFKDNNNGLISSWDNYLYRTTDGGNTWSQIDSALFISDNGVPIHTSDLVFSEDSTTLIAIGRLDNTFSDNQQFYRFSKDFGDTWTEPIALPPNIYTRDGQIYFRNDSIWICGTGSTGYYNEHGDEEGWLKVYFSPDLGKSWIPQILFISQAYRAENFRGISFYDNSLVGIIIDLSGPVMLTFDGGNQWVWLRDSITNYGVADPDGSGFPYYKLQLMKINNQMIIFGQEKIMKLINRNVPSHTGVANGMANDGNISLFYNPSAELIEVKSGTQSIIDKITIYDMNGRMLYSDGKITLNPYYISAKSLNNAKVVFAVIQAGNYVYFEKIMCE